MRKFFFAHDILVKALEDFLAHFQHLGILEGMSSPDLHDGAGSNYLMSIDIIRIIIHALDYVDKQDI